MPDVQYNPASEVLIRLVPKRPGGAFQSQSVQSLTVMWHILKYLDLFSSGYIYLV